MRVRDKGVYCNMHYYRLKTTGNLGGPHCTVVENGGPCAVDGCGEASIASGMCNMHYKRARRTGEVGTPHRLRARVGNRITAKGYRYLRVDGRYAIEHRHVMEQHLGRKLKADERVHHIDGDRLNNDPANLELWSHPHPSGQRAADKLSAAIDYLKEHTDELAEHGFRLVALESQASTDLLVEEGLDMYRLTPFMRPALI